MSFLEVTSDIQEFLVYIAQQLALLFWRQCVSDAIRHSNPIMLQEIRFDMASIILFCDVAAGWWEKEKLISARVVLRLYTPLQHHIKLSCTGLRAFAFLHTGPWYR